MTPARISPTQAARLIEAGAMLVDIREPDEHARLRIPAAHNQPINRLMPISGAPAVVYHCRSGARTDAHSGQLAAAADCQAYLLEGGIEAWRKAGLPILEDRKAPLEIMRQVQITTGLLVLTGVILGFAVNPAFFGLSAFVGAGLTFAGVSGWCGMARLLVVMPWNARAAQG